MDPDRDLVVIGAGWYGLAAAKTYLEVNPHAKLTVLESASTLGGTWAKERLFPGLKSNNLLGTYEYSDFPMDEKTFGVKPGNHIPGQVIHEYLVQYAKRFGVIEHIQYNSFVEQVERGPNNSWSLSITDKLSNKTTKLSTRKLIVATGLTSEPFLPSFNGQASFTEPLFHCKDFPKHYPLTDSAKSVIVFGGTKSAWDMVYAFASKGVHVDWIIRASGHGPCWMAPPYVTPLKKWLEKLVVTRFLTWFSPCTWGDADGYGGVRNWLHGTTVGRFIVKTFWNILNNDLLGLNGYDKHPETAKLKPWMDSFWTGAGLSILNYPTDIFDLVRGGMIQPRIADIVKLDGKRVHLSTGEVLDTDALACATGWVQVPPVKFVPNSLMEEMGLPQSAKPNNDILAQADRAILSQFPRLKDQPKGNSHYDPLPGSSIEVENRSFQLYRFMVPPELIKERNIGFAGMILCIVTSLSAQTQALWLTAHFNGEVPLPKDEHEVVWQTTLHNRYGKWRYPAGFGAKCPDFVFDTIPYLDMLLSDLGLKAHRKGGTLQEITDPYGPADYRGLVQEWIHSHSEGNEGRKKTD